jgi:hypothetical protein
VLIAGGARPLHDMTHPSGSLYSAALFTPANRSMVPRASGVAAPVPTTGCCSRPLHTVEESTQARGTSALVVWLPRATPPRPIA